jgi:hypothetical protein
MSSCSIYAIVFTMNWAVKPRTQNRPDGNKQGKMQIMYMSVQMSNRCAQSSDQSVQSTVALDIEELFSFLFGKMRLATLFRCFIFADQAQLPALISHFRPEFDISWILSTVPF